MSKSPRKFSVRARLKSFVYAFNGLKLVLKTEHNFWVHILAAIFVSVLGIWQGLDLTEWLFILSAVFLVIVSEAFNSALEYLADALHPDKNEGIGNAKDIASGAVLLASLYSIGVFLFVFLPKWI